MNRSFLFSSSTYLHTFPNEATAILKVKGVTGAAVRVVANEE